MNQTLNGSQAPTMAPGSPGVDAVDVASWVLSALVMFTCVCGIAGNGLVVWLLSFRVERTPYSVYVLHLAVADLLFLLCMASLVSLKSSLLANTQSLAQELLQRVKYFAYTAGLSLLTAISVHRCVSVLFPIWYKCHRPGKLSARACAGIWALSLVMNTLASVFCSWSWRWDSRQCFVVDLVLISLILGLFAPMMAVSSLTLFVRVRRSSARGRRRPTRLYMAILASVLVYFICALPLGIYWFLLYWLDLQPRVQLLYACLARLSSSVGSSANPVIYFLVGTRHGRGLRESLGAVLGRVLRDTPELEGRETPSSYTNEVGD